MFADLRVGIGVDVHAFDPDRPLWLAGLLWPGEVGLAGHSDADVACHAYATPCCPPVGWAISGPSSERRIPAMPMRQGSCC